MKEITTFTTPDGRSIDGSKLPESLHFDKKSSFVKPEDRSSWSSPSCRYCS